MENILMKSNLNMSFTPRYDGPPCTDDNALETYFNTAAVKSALHVDSSIDWVLCAEDLNYQTTVQVMSRVFFFHKKLIFLRMSRNTSSTQ